MLVCSNMECRIHLDVDCTYVEREDVTQAEGELRKIVEFLKADSGQLQPSQAEDSVYPSYDKKLVDIAFCNLIDRSVVELGTNFREDSQSRRMPLHLNFREGLFLADYN